MKAQAHYDQLVTELAAEIQKGNLPWRQPWFARYPCNLHTKRNYRGLNILALNWSAQRNAFASRFWITKKQAAERGGQIKPEEEQRSSRITFGKWVYKKWKDKRGVEHTDAYLMLRDHPVYNFEQTTGLDRLLPKEHHLDFTPLDAAEQIISGYQEPPRFEADGGKAYYQPFFDVIGLPSRSQFVNEQSYYATCFHEMIHSTGNSNRLRRFSFFHALYPQDETYAKEELVAEIGAAFLCAEAGIANATAKGSAAYLGHWLQALDDDHKTLFWAASAAQKAADWILNRRPPKENQVQTCPPESVPAEAKDILWT